MVGCHLSGDKFGRGGTHLYGGGLSGENSERTPGAD